MKDNPHAIRERSRRPGLIDSRALPVISPSKIPNLFTWYAARLETTYSNTDPVSQWTDKSGNGYHATQATGGLQPLYTTNSINGLATLTFNDDYLRMGAVSAGNNVSFFFVLKPTTTTPVGIVDTGPNVANIFRNYNTGNFEWHGNAPDIPMNLANTNAVLLSYLCSLAPSRAVDYYKNNSFIGNYTNASTTAMAWGSPVFGAINLGGAGYYAGLFAEVIIYSRTLTATEAGQIHSYLNRLYNLY